MTDRNQKTADADRTVINHPYREARDMVLQSHPKDDDLAKLVKTDNHMFTGTIFVWTTISAIVFCTAGSDKANGDDSYWGDWNANQDTTIWYYAQQMLMFNILGLGCLYCFLKRYNYSAMGYVLILSSFAGLLSVFWEGITYNWSNWNAGSFQASLQSLIGANYIITTVLVALGGVLGKFTPFQAVLLTSIAVPAQWINWYFVNHHIYAVDNGAQSVFLFGSMFGLAASYMMSSPACFNHVDFHSSTGSDRVALLGTLFVFVSFPAWVASGSYDNELKLSVVTLNTFFALIGSTVAYCVLSRVITKNHKFNCFHLQHSALAGGVGISACAAVPFTAAGALAVGFVSGAVCVLGYAKVSPFIAKHGKLHDTAGVFNAYALPAMVAIVVSCFVLPIARDSDVISTMLANRGDKLLFRCGKSNDELCDGAVLVAKQLVSGATSLFVGMAFGCFAGFLCNILAVGIPDDHVASDRLFWDAATDYKQTGEFKKAVAARHDQSAAHLDKEGDSEKSE
jgi:ammonium transporter Rh